MIFSSLSPFDAKTGRLNAVIDTPMGSRCKYKLDEKTGLVSLSKLLPLGATFPYNFGFIPGTRGEDGDALDILALMDEPVPIGCVVPLKLLGVICAEQSELDGQIVRNDRLIGVVETSYNPAEYSHIDDIHPRRLEEIEHFFVSYNQAQGRSFTPLGRHGPQTARDMITKSLI